MSKSLSKYSSKVVNYIRSKTNVNFNGYNFYEDKDYLKYNNKEIVNQIIKILNNNNHIIREYSVEACFLDGELFLDISGDNDSSYMCCGNPRSSYFFIESLTIPINLKIKNEGL